MVILKLKVRTAEEWRELAPGDSVSEPMFVPTTDELEAGQGVILEVASPLLPNKVLIRGTVQAWRPALPRMRVRAGATVELGSDEQPKLDFLGAMAFNGLSHAEGRGALAGRLGELIAAPAITLTDAPEIPLPGCRYAPDCRCAYSAEAVDPEDE